MTGPVGLIVKFSTLQEYGVDKVFVLENGNTDSSQRNIVYLVHGEKAVHVQAVAGTHIPPRSTTPLCLAMRSHGRSLSSPLLCFLHKIGGRQLL